MNAATKLAEPIVCDCCGKHTTNGWRQGHRKSCYPCAMTCWPNQSGAGRTCQIKIVNCETKGHSYKTREITSTQTAEVCTVCRDRINVRDTANDKAVTQ